jgi:hypothetical protein
MGGQLNVIDFGELDQVFGHLAARGQINLIQSWLSLFF